MELKTALARVEEELAKHQEQRVALQRKAFEEVVPAKPVVVGDVTLNSPMLAKMCQEIRSLGVSPIAIDKSRVHFFKERNPATGRLNSPVIAWVKSSKGDRAYEVKATDKGLGCDCPAWIFNGRNAKDGHRSCKHTDAVSAFVRVE